MALKIGIAGLRRGLGFARLFAARKDCRVVAVCDNNRQRAEEAATQVQANAFDDFNKFCDQPLDAIVIVTPPSTHFECTVRALDAGKHVLCEVPAITSMSQAEQLVNKVRQTGLKYMIAENVCYFPCIQLMHKIVAEGKLGQVVLAEGEYIHDCRAIMYNRDDGLGGGEGDIPSWRIKFNPIQYSTHELGPLLMILQDRIIWANCQESVFSEEGKSGIIHSQIALFKTVGGRTIRSLVAFKIAREPAHHFYCLYGTKGSVETDRYRWTDNLKLYYEEDADHKVLFDVATSLTHPEAPPEALAGGHGTSEYYMVDDFVRSILEDKQPPLDVYKALDMTVPGLCAVDSAQKGGELVPVPIF
ncbi:MAG: Gfo/Idh/MocA family oxidoreductase [Phycisphaerae bacterium]